MKKHILSLLLAGFVGLFCSPAAGYNANLYEQRAMYTNALEARSVGRITEFKRIKEDLDGYPLQIYLEYYELARNIGSVNEEKLEQIKLLLKDTPLGDRFVSLWLEAQAARGRWERYVNHFIETEDAAKNCKYVHALHMLGRREEALSLVPELWVVGVSQPKVCDRLFAIWFASEQMTVDHAWQRLQLTLGENQRALARYLMRFFPEVERPYAQLIYDAHVNPRIVTNVSRFPNDEWGRTALRYALLRYAISEGTEALKLFIEHGESYAFSPEERIELEGELMFWATREGFLPPNVKAEYAPHVIERIVDTAVSHRDYQSANAWLAVYPEEERHRFKYRYWSAIVELELTGSDVSPQLEELARERTYYGFLAAHRLGIEPSMNESAEAIDPDVKRDLMADLRVQRLFELYAVEDRFNAEQEWRWLLPQLNEPQQMALVQAMMKAGWNDQAIRAANTANLMNLLMARFPYAYVDLFRRGAHAVNVDLTFLLALARQESAFNPKARSRVGARGIMQLMLATARGTASRINEPRPTNESLYDPVINIKIGTHHIAELLVEFGGHTILAAAAYNAGKHRVFDWVENCSGMDTIAWIETIPYAETRSYVKNLIAFKQVYAFLLNEPTPVLQDNELTIPII